MLQIFDKFAMLIKDSNSKVQLLALESLIEILPHVKSHITGSSVNMLVQNTAAGLASKNKDIYDSASNLLDSFINNIGRSTVIHYYIIVKMLKRCDRTRSNVGLYEMKDVPFSGTIVVQCFEHMIFLI